jgi:ATP-binding cassette, subfamily B, bacterial PglK
MNSFNTIIKLLTSDEKFKLFNIFLLIFTCSLLEMLGIGLIFPILNLILDPVFFENNNVIQLVKQKLKISDKNILIIVILSLMMLLNLIKSLILSLTAWRQARDISKIHIRITNDLYLNYIKSPWEFIMHKNSGALIRNIHSSTHELTSKMITGYILLASEFLIIIFICTLLIIINFKITIFALIFFSILGFISQGITRKYNYKFGEIRSKNLKLINKHIIETFRSFKLIKVFNKENVFSSKYLKISKDEIDSKTYQEVFQRLPRIWIEFLTIFFIGSITIFSLKFIDVDGLAKFIPLLGVFVAALYKLLPSLAKILNTIQTFRFAYPAIKILHNDMLKFKKYKSYLLDRQSKPNALEFNTKITFKNIKFRYPNTQNYIFDNFSYKIEKNKTIGIIGKSGSGKSTLVDLLMAILNPESGQILIDDKDLIENKLAWQNKIGYVPQETYLLDDTIKNNVAFGVKNEFISSSKVLEAINKSGLKSVIENLPQQTDTYTGDNGVKLSGGQKQRIGLARAIYLSPEVLILDEATSALDIETEKKILNLLKEYKNKITIIIISHRDSILPYCDEILELNNL